MTLIRPTIINNKVWKIELILDDPQPLEILQQPEQLVKTLRETPSKPETSTTFSSARCACRHSYISIPVYQFGEMVAVIKRCTRCGHTEKDSLF